MYIFGYGSLMWNPNFKYLEKKEFVLKNYMRDFCIKTNHHRGCDEQFGIVLGLKYSYGDICKGILYKVEDSEVSSTLDYLDTRELCEDSYLKTKLHQNDISILAYTVNKESKKYVTSMSDKEKANVIQIAKGYSGYNIDYYLNTIKEMKRMKIENDLVYNIEKFLK